jgi:hypothetical protein
MVLAGQHAGEKERARFDREATIVARLRHPNIVGVYEKGERDGVPYLVMEYCEKGSLTQQLEGRSHKGFDELVLRVLRDDPIRPRSLDPNVPRDLETICLKCLEKHARHRYPSAAALADDLGRFLDNRPIAARPVGLAARAWRWCRRNRTVASLAASAVLLLCAAATATYAAFLFRARCRCPRSAAAALFGHATRLRAQDQRASIREHGGQGREGGRGSLPPCSRLLRGRRPGWQGGPARVHHWAGCATAAHILGRL